MSKNKLQKFAALLGFPNVYENQDPRNPRLIGKNGTPVELKGKWASHHFQNDHPIILELACGKGHYTTGLAKRFSDRNFIGVDVKGARIWTGAKTALEEKLDNAAFLRTRIEQINLFFEKDEVDEIWITFPDPFLKKGKANRRLTSPRFLTSYQNFLKKGGLVHLKTDSPELYEFTLEVLEQQKDWTLLYHEVDIYSKPLFTEELSIKTYYENMHLEVGKTIKYVRFRW